MQSEEMRSFLPFVEELQEKAGQIIRSFYGQPLAVEHKADDSPVTRADRETEAVLRGLIEARYPTHSIQGEEYGEKRGSSGWRWILDPIDGTKSFVLQTPLFGTLIALERDGVPVLGSIHFPLLERLLIGSAETGTFLNGVACRVSSTSDLAQATMIITDPRDLLPHPGHELVIALASQVRLVRGFGDCYGYFLVASGLADLMVEPKNLQYYDIAPMPPLLSGAGGIFSAFDGSLDFRQGQGLAANPRLHAEVRAIVEKITNQSPLG
ncbi:MAG: inositol monophosphatase family protein [Blastocatellia bacterium]